MSLGIHSEVDEQRSEVDLFLEIALVARAEINTMGMTQKEAIMQTMTSWEEKGMEKERQTIALSSSYQYILLSLNRQTAHRIQGRAVGHVLVSLKL